MPRIEFERSDLPVSIERADEAEVLLRVGRPGHAWALQAVPVALMGALEGRIARAPLARDAFVWRESAPEPKVLLLRIVLDVTDPILAGLNWEQILARMVDVVNWPVHPVNYYSARMFVRASHVRPRALNLPLMLPLRILHVAPRPDHHLEEWVRALFGTHPRELVDQAVRVATVTGWDLPEDWPVVDVVHVGVLEALGDASMTLSMAVPDRAGTLGWLTRWTDRWQTRLIVLNASSPAQASAARCVARALGNKGGPAVLVVEAGAQSAEFYHAFYDRLVHDDPLDWIVAQTAREGTALALSAGEGREEALRPSNVARRLVRLAARPLDVFRLDDDLARRVRRELSAVDDDWRESRFNLHEREGLLPLIERLGRLREIARGDDQLAVVRGGYTEPQPTKPAPEDAEPRVVNASFALDDSGRLHVVPQDGAVLRRGEMYHLRLVIGPKDADIKALDLSVLLEEQFKWTPDVEGVWVELGITGIDFSVMGDPVQTLWLPRTGASEPVYVPVIPTRAGIAQLRFGLYYENNLLQSFRMAAIVEEANEPFGGDRARELAEALAVGPTRIGEAGYISRLEYSRTSAPQVVDHKRGRSLCITTNRLDGKNILTLKGDDIFEVEVYPDSTVRNAVTALRKVLNEVSYSSNSDTSIPLYQFGRFAKPETLDARFSDAMVRLASAGSSLFTTLAPKRETRDALRAHLSGSSKVIQVAPLLRDKVIPWAFVYDRLYDERARKIDGEPVQQGVCRAALPKAGSAPRTLTCGEHDECLLNSTRQAERQRQGDPLYHERTVACPLHFWGFSHVIEVPPQQVEDGATPSEERRCIVPSGSPRLVAGLSHELDDSSNHWKTVSTSGTWEMPIYARDDILSRLKNTELDLVYFFCHARGGEAEVPRIEPPYLDFDTNDPDSHIEPKDFADDIKWQHGPLFVLNACGTVGYSPDALSPFLKALVDGRGASGILGTEVPVAEVLATDVACAFLKRFVAGMQAGRALLETRWELLATRNPLGLVYTLFAPASLALDVSNKGDCA